MSFLIFLSRIEKLKLQFLSSCSEINLDSGLDSIYKRATYQHPVISSTPHVTLLSVLGFNSKVICGVLEITGCW